MNKEYLNAQKQKLARGSSVPSVRSTAVGMASNRQLVNDARSSFLNLQPMHPSQHYIDVLTPNTDGYM